MINTAKKAKGKKTFAKSSAGQAVSAVKSAVFGGKGKGGKRKKKSALWYIKEKQRLKAKKAYERERMRL